MENRLYNVRDLHWFNPSNIRNSGNIPSSKTNFLGWDTGVALTGVTYRENRVVFSGSEAGLRYAFRPTSTFNIPTHVKVKMHASNIQAKLYIEDLEIGDIGSFNNNPEVKESTIALQPYHLEKILSYRLFPSYENYSIECVNQPNLVIGSSNPVAVYGFEVSLIGTGTYQNYISNTISSPIRLLPTGVTRTNVHWKNHDNSGLNVERFNSSPTGVNVNSSFIEAQNEPTLVSDWRNTMPSGFLSVFFNSNNNQTVNVNRARVSFNMSLPVSGSRGNFRDKIDIYGRSRTFNYSFNSLLNNDWLNIPEPGSEESDPPTPTGLHPLVGSCWGYSDIIENSGFVTYNVDLAFTDPERILTPTNSSNASSRKYAHLAAFQNMELMFVGVPSGARLSAMELILETKDSNNLDLFISSYPKQNNNITAYIDGNTPKQTGFTDLYTAQISNFNTGYPCGIVLDEKNDPVLDSFSNYIVSGDEECDNKNLKFSVVGHEESFLSTNLYLQGVFKVNNGFPEFEGGEYEGAWALEDNIPPFTIIGHESLNLQTTLFLKVPEPINSSIGLHTIGVLPTLINSNMNLFVRGLDPPTINNSIPFVVRSTAEAGLFAISDLFLQAFNYNPDNSMPLYITNSTADKAISTMNLFIGNDIRKSDSLQLFVSNNNQQINNFKRLFLKASNTYTYNSNMNLFIQRDFEGLTSSLNMFLKTVDGDSIGTNLYIPSAYKIPNIFTNQNDYNVNNLISLWMFDFSNYYLSMFTIGSDINPNSNSDLFISGF